jgi:Fur family ferric uptake transcriptional regulator
MTRQRQVILEEFRNANSHLTADDVYNRVRQRLPKISLGTVYRNLEILSEAGVIGKLEMGGAQKIFDGRPNEHYHIRCIKCGRVDDVPGRPAHAIEDIFGDTLNYQIVGHHLVLFGVCPDCGKSESETQMGLEDATRKEK